MVNIIFTIPNEKIPRIREAMVGLFKIPRISDPSWVDPEDGSKAPIINEFTDNQWAKESIRRWVIKQVRRWEHAQATQTAIESVVEDNTLLS